MWTSVRIAILNTHAGAPGTLASTAFIGAITDGFMQAGVETRIVGLTQSESTWVPASLAPFQTGAPWLDVPPASLADNLSAVRAGIMDGASTETATDTDWYLELLLQRELENFAGGDRDLVVMVYPRVLRLLRMAARIVRRKGWKLLVFSTESLTDAQIDPDTRDEYVIEVVTQADGVWALSEYLVEYWKEKGLPEERIFINPPAVRQSAFRRSAPPRASSAVYVGNLQHREVDYLLHVAESVHPSMPDFHLTVYGDATEERRRELSTAIDSLGLSGTVSIRPSVLPARIPETLVRADVLLLPRSKGEFSLAGFPNKLGEYLAAGRPVIVTAVGDIPRYLEDGVSAIFVEPDDCEAFASALVNVLSDMDLADRVGASGQLVAERISASTVVGRRLIDFIDELPRRGPLRVPMRTRIARVMLLTAGPRILMRQHAASLAYRATHTKSGHTRYVAFKMWVVSVLEFLGLRPRARDGSRPE